MINNYADLDPTSVAKLDFMGFLNALARTYDGHRGLDVDIPTFREMDSDKAVVRAAAAGEVIAVDDGNYDRNTSCTGQWNVVYVMHKNGFTSIYGHLKNGSIVVTKGDQVSAGTKLGVVGSSGCSTQPHLHFEVLDCNGSWLETFNTMWQSPPLYHGPSYVMDVVLRESGITHMDQIKDPLPNVKVIAPGATLGIGLSLAARQNDKIKFSLVSPSSTADVWEWTVNGNARYSHYYPSWEKVVGTTVGTWVLRVYVNNVLHATRTFNVSNYKPGWAEIAKHGVSASSYQNVFTDITAAGYRPVWVDGYQVGSTSYFNAIFRPANGVQWVARHGLSGSAYQSEFNNWTGQGYRLLQIDSYLHGSSVRYAAIFIKALGFAWVAYHGVTESQHINLFNNYASLGYRAVNVSLVSVNGSRRVTALYDKGGTGGSWVAYHKLSASSYQSTFDAQKSAGRYLRYLNTYVHNGNVYYTGIWYQTSYSSYLALHGQTSSNYQTYYDLMTGAGYLTQFVTGHFYSGHRFAGLWAK